MSKKTFDAAILQAQNPRQIHHQAFAQTPQGYASFFKWLQQQAATSEVLICMEHTGIYSNGLVAFLMQQHLPVWVEMPLRIKKCMGLQRGGDDKLAAIHIAQYAWRHRDQARLWKPATTRLEELRQYIAQRDRLVLARNQLTVPFAGVRRNRTAKAKPSFVKASGAGYTVCKTKHWKNRSGNR